MKMIEIEHISKSFKDTKALDDISLTIEEGELFGLLGVNGAGKTTLISILSTLYRLEEGKAYIDAKDVQKEREEVKKIIAISPQETAIASNLTVKENLAFFASIYDQKDEEYIKNLIHTFHLEEVLLKKAKTLSGGWKRRLSIALSLLSKPKVLFLDEPTLGLDVLVRRELWKIILSFKGKMTIVLTSHYLEEIESLCDRVAILNKGKLKVVGSVNEIKEKTKQDSLEDAFVTLMEEEENENR